MQAPKENLVKQLVRGETPKGLTLLLRGESGVGKTVFASNVFGEQLRKGVKCLYVALERPIENFIDYLQNEKYPVEQSRIVLLDAYSWRLGGDTQAKYHLKGLSNLSELSVKILSAASEMGRGGFYLVDSLTNLVPYNHEREILHFFGLNSARLKNINASGIWIVEEGIHQPSFYNMLNHLADGVLEMTIADNDRYQDRLIRANILRGRPNSIRWLGIDVSEDGGVTLKRADAEDKH